MSNGSFQESSVRAIVSCIMTNASMEPRPETIDAFEASPPFSLTYPTRADNSRFLCAGVSGSGSGSPLALRFLGRDNDTTTEWLNERRKKTSSTGRQTDRQAKGSLCSIVQLFCRALPCLALALALDLALPGPT